MSQPQALYRFYGDSGVLLYVGITKDMPSRMSQHQAEKHWWSEVRGISIEWYPDRTSVAAAEARAIAVEQPLHNVALRRKPLAGSAPIVAVPVDITWTCDSCGHPVLGDEGYVHVNRVQASHVAARAADREREQATRSSWSPVDLSPYLERDYAAWAVHHAQCDPEPEGPDYWITTDRVATHADLLRWTLHLIEKRWVLDGTDWTEFAAKQAGGGL